MSVWYDSRLIFEKNFRYYLLFYFKSVNYNYHEYHGYATQCSNYTIEQCSRGNNMELKVYGIKIKYYCCSTDNCNSEEYYAHLLNTGKQKFFTKI